MNPGVTQEEYNKARNEEEDRDYKRVECHRCDENNKVAIDCPECPISPQCLYDDNVECPLVPCPTCKGTGRIRVER